MSLKDAFKKEKHQDNKMKVQKQFPTELEEEAAEYDQFYHNILWIDDLSDPRVTYQNCYSRTEKKLKWLAEIVHLSKQDSKQIDIPDSFTDTVDIITQNPDFDLVVFDINLEKWFDATFSDTIKQQYDDLFSKYYIPFDFNEIMKNKGKNAGYILYKLLLSVGYPLNRMIICSAHTDKTIAGNEIMGIKFSGNMLFMKDEFKDKKTSFPLESFFSNKECEYYRVRRLVYQACYYWTNQLNNDLKETDKTQTPRIPFNRLFFKNEKGNLRNGYVTSDEFKDMLEHVKMLFPIALPSEPEKIYYQALRTLAGLHENKANLESLKEENKTLRLKSYHNCVRNFRNWSAHNKFKTTTINAEKFAFLFCIALRVFFSWSTDMDLEEPKEKLLDYEKTYGLDISEKPDFDHIFDLIQEKYFSIAETTLPREDKDKDKDKRRPISSISLLQKSLEAAVKSYGNGNNKMDDYLFVPIWCPEFPLYETKTINNTEKGEKPDIIIRYKQDEIEEFLKRSTKDNCEGVFMRYCYHWFLGTESSEYAADCLMDE